MRASGVAIALWFFYVLALYDLLMLGILVLSENRLCLERRAHGEDQSGVGGRDCGMRTAACRLFDGKGGVMTSTFNSRELHTLIHRLRLDAEQMRESGKHVYALDFETAASVIDQLAGHAEAVADMMAAHRERLESKALGLSEI